MILDLVLLIGSIIAFVVGFSQGLITSLLSLIGYLGGALGALFLVIKFSSRWEGKLSVVLIYLAAIILGSALGQAIFHKIGKGIRKKVLLGPLKLLDSILGAGLSSAKYFVVALLLITVIRYLPLSLVAKWISGSRIYESASTFNLLSLQISDLLKSVSSHLDQLT